MLFDKVDLSGIPEKLKDALGQGEQALSDGLNNLKKQSEPIAASALLTFELTKEAVEKFVAGKIDAEGVAFVWQEGIRQTVILASAEKNLLLSASVSFLKSIGGIVLRTGLAMLDRK